MVTPECTRRVIDPSYHSRHNGRDRQHECDHGIRPLKARTRANNSFSIWRINKFIENISEVNAVQLEMSCVKLPLTVNLSAHVRPTSGRRYSNTAESGRRQLRSSTTNATFVVRTRTQFGKRAFSVCGLSIWNQIPPHIRNLHSAPAFRKALKTHLFL